MCPSRSRPDFGQSIEDGPESCATVRTEQAGHVLQEEPTCAAGDPNRDNVSDDPALIVEAGALASCGDGLAGESGRDEVDGRWVVDGTEVSEVGGRGVRCHDGGGGSVDLCPPGQVVGYAGVAQGEL
jgi:hypothetical protein